MSRYLKLFIEYVSFNVISMIGLSAYIMADTYFISKGMGADGLTSLNLALPFFSLLTAIGLMFGVGGASIFIVSKVKGNIEESNSIFSTMIYSGIITGILIMIIGNLFNSQITSLLGANESTYEMTSIYIRVIMTFAPAFILNNIIAGFVKNDGNPNLVMIAMLSSSFFNIVFDYIFIFPFNMGMFGAVMATVFSPIIGLTILSRHFKKKSSKLNFKPQKLNKKIFINCVSNGVPSFVMEMASGIVMYLFNILILSLAGNDGVAAYGVMVNIQLIIVAIYNGVAQGSQPVFGIVYAESNTIELKKVLKYSLTTIVIITIILNFITFMFPNELTTIFNSDNNQMLQELSVKGFPLYFSQCIFLGINTVLIMYFVSINNARISQIMSALKGFILIVPISILLSKIFGINGIWISMTITESIVFIIGIIAYYKTQKLSKQ